MKENKYQEFKDSFEGVNALTKAGMIDAANALMEFIGAGLNKYDMSDSQEINLTYLWEESSDLIDRMTNK